MTESVRTDWVHGTGNCKKDIQTSGRARNMERSNQELRDLYKNLDIIADIKTEETEMDWTCSKDGSGKDS